MKYKLTDVSFDKITYTTKEINYDKYDKCIINVKYISESLEFQTPKILIQEIIKENEKEYLILKIIGNKACKSFFDKIHELEKSFEKHFKVKVNSIFENDHFKVKVPFISEKPNIKVYHNNQLFNYYQLSKGMEIICLLQCDKLWKDPFHLYYNLHVKEIMLLKK
jgi:hypothetical protein